MNDRSATTTKDTLFRATSIQPATLIRTFAVGLHQGQRTWFPRKQAGHMTASRQPVQNVEKKTLANQGRPHMARREAADDYILRLIEEPGEISCVFQFGGF